ncbi:Protein gooseberry [Toxocara canis]|uniref:Protein gooseberry n=1 Tax=Toxocara canis TaxID=6265 RepID=A0A0B2V4D4_TOXCA|nr:Protein gooseberry [Toxocara canis]
MTIDQWDNGILQELAQKVHIDTMSPTKLGLHFSSCGELERDTCTPLANRLIETSIKSDDEATRKPSNKKRSGARCTKGTGTNLYGRPYCPGRPLSMEDRGQIIELHMGGMKVNAISKQLCISHGCVSKIISRYRETGMLSPASSPEQRRPRRTKKNSLPTHPSAPSLQTDQEQYPLYRSQSLY